MWEPLQMNYSFQSFSISNKFLTTMELFFYIIMTLKTNEFEEKF